VTHIVHLGDCLTGMAAVADRSVDVALTDPPFRRALYEKFRTNGSSHQNDYGSASDNYLALASEAIGALEDVLVPAAEHLLRLTRRWIVVFHDMESGHLWREAFGDAYVRSGVWVKTNPMPQVSGDRPAQGCEGVTIAHGKRESGRMRWNGGGRPATWIGEVMNSRPDSSERQGNGHPCPKPEWLMLALVRDFTDPGELVLDPFAGSCTTGVACKRLGRRFLGWERDPRYFEIGRKRLENAREQMGLWPGAA
jgi:site-specific DNA-methyltransferase (adenine-specific)